MRAHQIMTQDVITVSPEATIVEAAAQMLAYHVSGLPVVDKAGGLVGIVSEGDFLRRAEIGTQRKYPSWLQFFMGPGRSGADFVRERGRKVAEVMTRDPLTVSPDATLQEIVALMEKSHIKRIPVVQGAALVGIVTRANLLRAVAGLAHDIPDPTADDEHIRDRISRTIMPTLWRPVGFQVAVRNGVVHLHGLITDERSREAAIVAAENTSGVKEVHDHLCLVDTWSGFYVESPEDRRAAG